MQVKTMNKKLVILDLICYVAIPFLIWTYGREVLGDYWAILLSTVPGFIYTVYRFIIERQFNIAGIFIIGSLILGTMVNLLSSSVERMLWNQVYLGLGYAGIFLLSILLKKPLALFFAVDWVYLQGHPRESSKKLFMRKGIFWIYQLITGLFVLRSVFQNSLKAWLLQTYGADGYGQMIIYMSISGWLFTGLITAGFIYSGIIVNNYVRGKFGDTVHSDLN